VTAVRPVDTNVVKRQATITADVIRDWRFLPPCGGGLRRGVAPSMSTGDACSIAELYRFARPPTPSRPHKGGRERNFRPSGAGQSQATLKRRLKD
jgi:hypothetical protein